MIKKLLLLSIVFFATSLVAEANKSFGLSNIFGNNMILQRDKPVSIWGWAKPDSKITVTFANQKKDTVTDKGGNWLVSLAPMPANDKPQNLIVTGGDQLAKTIKFNNILVGDVWICSGQSNMAWKVCHSEGFKQEIKNANRPLIRQITIQLDNADLPKKNIFRRKWYICTPKNFEGFSAVGYYFAVKLQEELKIPIGIISSSWGGSRIEPWIPKLGYYKYLKKKQFAQREIKMLELIDVTKKAGKNASYTYLNKLEKWIESARKKIKKGKNPDIQPTKITLNNHLSTPTRIYNGMIAPLIKYSIRGVIWYQGESNEGCKDDAYYYQMHALVKSWRDVFKQGNFPFYWVQLASFQQDLKKPSGKGYSFANIRNQQRRALDIPNTGMAVTIDIGARKNIHPPNKKDVGLRLAQCALAKEYNKKIIHSGPLYKKHVVKNNKIIIYFTNIGKGLMIAKKEGSKPAKRNSNGELKTFSISDKNGKWAWAKAVINGNTVIVSSPDIKNPVDVNYAHFGYPNEANLYNKNGLPAAAFSSVKF